MSVSLLPWKPRCIKWGVFGVVMGEKELSLLDKNITRYHSLVRIRKAALFVCFCASLKFKTRRLQVESVKWRLFLCSLLQVALSPTVTSLSLHCNHISRIEGLTSARHLRHLDLSSNKISLIEGLSTLTSLRTLNLSCNLITKVEGECLVSSEGECFGFVGVFIK